VSQQFCTPAVPVKKALMVFERENDLKKHPGVMLFDYTSPHAKIPALWHIKRKK